MPRIRCKPPTRRPPHVCLQCKKTFTTGGHLTRHTQIHTGVRNHPCPFPGCETRCSRADNLHQHYKTHLDSYVPRKSKPASGRASKKSKSRSNPKPPRLSSPGPAIKLVLPTLLQPETDAYSPSLESPRSLSVTSHDPPATPPSFFPTFPGSNSSSTTSLSDGGQLALDVELELSASLPDPGPMPDLNLMPPAPLPSPTPDSALALVRPKRFPCNIFGSGANSSSPFPVSPASASSPHRSPISLQLEIAQPIPRVSQPRSPLLDDSYDHEATITAQECGPTSAAGKLLDLDPAVAEVDEYVEAVALDPATAPLFSQVYLAEYGIAPPEQFGWNFPQQLQFQLWSSEFDFNTQLISALGAYPISTSCIEDPHPCSATAVPLLADFNFVRGDDGRGIYPYFSYIS